MSNGSLRDSKLGRRMVTVPAVLLGAFLALPLSLVVLPVGVVVDLLRGRPRQPTARVLLFGLSYLAWEIVAVVASLGLWVASGFGALLGTRRFQEVHRRIQVVWASSHIRVLDCVLGIRLEVTGVEHLAPGPVIVLSRHTSMVDTLLPIELGKRVGLGCRYVMKHELLWDPALDLMGHRFPNYFVDRSGGNSRSAIDDVGDLAAGTGPEEMFVIFPEGSRFSEAKRARALEKLRDAHPVMAERAEKLTATLPPRTGGPIAALARRPPGADVVVIAHTGLEGMAGPKDLWRAVPFRHPVKIHVTRHPGDEVPDDPDAQLHWLYDRWTEVDTWVRDHREPA